jgi:N-acetylglucosaminyldiphosphoundecaprenol N-acetyl-beta-D-mannosaminyltransferase
LIRQLPHPPVDWPPKRELFGLGISVTTYRRVVRAILEAAKRREPAIVSFHPVSAVVETSGTPSMLAKVNRFQIVAPDGQPVRWALNWLYGTCVRHRVCGPDTTLLLCRRAAKAGVAVFFYGSTPETLRDLQANLRRQAPALRIAGAISPPYRPLTPEEDERFVTEINSSGAGIVFIGLGYPRQDLFADAHRDCIVAVQVCVGAAFDFHAGRVRRAPRWMQRSGLEWCHRLAMEPRRLWRRYFVTNTVFLLRLGLALLRRACSSDKSLTNRNVKEAIR